MAALRIVGHYLSPYVRKVLAALDLKGLADEIDPVVPFYGDERLTRLSPLRRVPVLVDDRATRRRSSASSRKTSRRCSTTSSRSCRRRTASRSCSHSSS